MKELYGFQRSIKTKKDFEKFLYLLKKDFEENKHEWENDTLEHFLEGLYGFNYDSSENSKHPSWKEVAEMLLAAIVYE